MKKFGILILALISLPTYAEELELYSSARFKLANPKLVIEEAGVSQEFNNFTTDFGLSVAVGVFVPTKILNLNFEAELDVYNFRLDLKYPPSPVSKFNVLKHSVFFNGYTEFKIPHVAFLLPYLGLGFGFTSHDAAYSTTGPSSLVDVASSDYKLGWQVAGGLRFAINHPWLLGIGYRYFDYGKIKSSSATGRYSSNEIVIDFTARF